MSLIKYLNNVGRWEERTEVTLYMIQENLDISVISRLAGLSEEAIKKVKRKSKIQLVKSL